ncbi:MAG TPA: dihydrolipoamide acetyltransferase family protein [Bacillales bacterium]|nr:dihydrolipoamide acetyltransferase family protein [Bacillales bacterium]
MAIEVIMPKMGMSMEEGTVVEWLKKEGQFVEKEEPVAVISSEKITKEIEAPVKGYLIKIEADQDDTVAVGKPIGFIGERGEQVTDSTSADRGNETSKQVAATAEAPEKPDQRRSQPAKKKVRISPAAKKMAKPHGIVIEELEGTGPGGRITKEDVENAIHSVDSTEPNPQAERKANGQDKQPEQLIPWTGMRKVIAARMQSSLSDSAQLTITMKADVTQLVTLKEQMAGVLQKNHNTKLSLNDFVARAVVLSLQQNKQMNSTYSEEGICLFSQVHLGMAVALNEGLVVPVIRNADQLSLMELSLKIKSLAEEARQGRLATDDMTGSTFTITNLGGYGVEFFTPILNPPETGILGTGAVEDTPVYKDDQLQRRSMLPMSLTFDHRIMDGAPAAQFLSTIKQYLEEPFTILL